MDSLTNRSEYLGVLPLTAKFVLDNAKLSWPEILWGHDMGMIGWYELKEFARTSLQSACQTDDDKLSQLARLTKEDASTAGDLARSVSEAGPDLDETAARRKWAYLLLKRLYERRDHITDPFGVIEHIYADFDYPEELEGFVRWMPASEPVATPEEGQAKMDQRWRAYLAKSAVRFGHT